MKPKLLIAAAVAALATIASQPASAYRVAVSGRTVASPQLRSDIFRAIAAYSKATGGCSFLFTARMAPMSAGPSANGVYNEHWTLNACGAKQHFQVALWPSPRGGTDFAVRPLTGRLPLYSD